MKCKCGVELFGKDLVERVTTPIYISKSLGHMPCITETKYRCPKCFKIKKVKFKGEKK